MWQRKDGLKRNHEAHTRVKSRSNEMQIKGEGKVQNIHKTFPDMKSSGTYKECSQILSFGDRIEEYRERTLGNGLDISLTIPLQLAYIKLLKLATTNI